MQQDVKQEADCLGGKRKKPSLFLTGWQWKRADGTWVSFDVDASEKIDSALKDGPPFQLLSDEDIHTIDLKTLTTCREVNSKISKSISGDAAARQVHSLRRWKEACDDDNSLMQLSLRIRERYPTWEEGPSHVQEYIVNQGSADYAMVQRRLFEDSGPIGPDSYEISRIVRVQNRTTLMRYEIEREATLLRREQDVKEKYLFHGTGCHSPLKLAKDCKGFDIDGRSTCFYGRGCYFALKSCYSIHYAFRSHDLEATLPQKDGQYIHMILAKVLCGRSKKEPHPWPKHEIAKIGIAREKLGTHFDSVEGGPHRPKQSGPGEDDSVMYVVYNSNQAMAEFVVTIKAKELAENHISAYAVKKAAELGAEALIAVMADEPKGTQEALELMCCELTKKAQYRRKTRELILQKNGMKFLQSLLDHGASCLFKVACDFLIALTPVQDGVKPAGAQELIKVLIFVLGKEESSDDCVHFAIRSISNISEREPNSIAVKAGLPVMIRLLQRQGSGYGSSQKWFCLVCETLQRWVRNEEILQLAVEQELVRVLIEKLEIHSHSDSVVQEICALISAMTRCDQAQKLAASQEGLNVAMAVMMSSKSSVKVLECTASLILRLVRCGPQYRKTCLQSEQASETGCIKAVLAILERQCLSDVVLHESCDTLMKFTQHPHNAGHAGIEGVRILMAIFTRKELLESTWQSVCRSLVNIIHAHTHTIDDNGLRQAIGVEEIRAIISKFKEIESSSESIDLACSLLRAVVLDAELARIAAQEGGVQAIIAFLGTQKCSGTQDLACDALLDMVVADPASSKFAGTEAITTLTVLLTRAGVSEGLQLSSLKCLKSIITADLNLRRFVGTSGARAIVGSLRSTSASEATISTACGLLKVVVSDDKMAAIAAQEGGVQAIIAFLGSQSRSERSLHLACDAFLDMVVADPASSKFAGTEAITTLSALLTRAGVSEGLQLSSLKCLKSIITADLNLRRFVGTSGARAIVGALRSTSASEATISTACGLLKVIVSDDKMALIVAREGGVHAVIDILKKHPVVSGVGSLRTIIEQSENMLQYGSLLGLTSTTDGLLAVACDTLRHLILLDEKNRNVVVMQGGLRTVAFLLTKEGASSDLLLAGYKVLHVMATNLECMELVGQDQTSDLASESLSQMDGPHSVLEKACRALSKLVADSIQSRRNRCEAMKTMISLIQTPRSTEALDAVFCNLLVDISVEEDSWKIVVSEGGIHEVIQILLRDKSELSLTAACGALKKFVECPRNWQLAGKVGGVQALITMLQKSGQSEAVLFHGCDALSALTMDVVNAKTAGEEGGIKVTLALLQKQSTTMEVLEVACSALFEMSEVRENAVLIRREGIKPIASLLLRKDVSNKLQVGISSLLLNICASDGNSKLAENEIYVKEIIKLLKDQDKPSRMSAAACFVLNMLAMPVDVRVTNQEMRDEGVRHIVALLQWAGASNVLMRGALEVLLPLISHGRMLTYELIDAVVMVMTRQIAEDELLDLACRALRVMAPLARLTSNVGDKSISVLISVLRKEGVSDGLVISVCKTICSVLSANVNFARQLIVRQGDMKTMISLLRSEDVSDDVLVMALKAVAAISMSDESMELIGSCGGIRAVIKVVMACPLSATSLQRKACKLLLLLANRSPVNKSKVRAWSEGLSKHLTEIAGRHASGSKMHVLVSKCVKLLE